MAIYAGEPITAAGVLLDGEHALHHQSYAPNELLSGSVNADGFGVGWYDRKVSRQPGCYRRSSPIWADRDLPGLGRLLSSEILLANVRNATDSSTSGVHSAQPYNEGDYLFMHNGFVEGFREKMKRQLRGRLSDRGYAALQTSTDSETLFQLLVDALDAGDDLAAAMVALIGDLDLLTREAGLTLQLNMALSDGQHVVVSRWSNVERSNSLYLLDRDGAFPEGSMVASEPLTPGDAWAAVPHQSLVTLSPGRPAEVQPLQLPPS
ncbi:MAG: class II glutamine amidotransferase [Candidatus Marinimicrobia bacterium]|nr:class II glutamine amidotransferase [Candidatus Neomarinimicrobiota bacterium]